MLFIFSLTLNIPSRNKKSNDKPIIKNKSFVKFDIQKIGELNDKIKPTIPPFKIIKVVQRLFLCSMKLSIT